ncbi:hypothetical protein TrVE_jg3149 [Triparma verrucosa]|uniref:DNA damage-binding protein 1 n=1 Tax=Triparma verrucosa TaxID=1606542 RepID=A0A9W7BIM8_9STRA|nr:hypothetical protein TrVE_jg3149 [Triparma verrucosa]
MAEFAANYAPDEAHGSYVVTLHKSTNITHSTTCCFTASSANEDKTNLVLAKANVLEIHTLTPDGLTLEHELPCNGRISSLNSFVIGTGEAARTVLTITTDRYKTASLIYENGEVVTLSSGDLRDQVGAEVEKGHLAIVDETYNLCVMCVYAGYLKVIPIDAKTGAMDMSSEGPSFNATLDEPDGVLDIQFLHGLPQPAIAVLYVDNRQRHFLKTYTIVVNKQELQPGPWNTYQVEAGASMLISTPLQAQKGILVVGQKTITFHNGTTTKAIPMQPTMMQAWANVGDEGNRFLLGDHLGNMYVVVISTQNNVLHSLHIESLGETSTPSTISYLDNGVVFLGSSYGDSQLIKLTEERDQATGSYLNLLQEYPNLGPIVDFTLADLDRRGQSQIVTCSGSKKDGSIRVVRNGIGINEQASVELPGIKGMWRLRSSTSSSYDRFLVQSFISETRILEINADEMEETEIAGFSSSSPTLFASNVQDDMFVQVTETCVNLVSAADRKLLHNYNPPSGSKITVAGGSENGQLLIAAGKVLIYLNVSNSKVNETTTTTLQQEVSCINLSPFDSDLNADSDAMSDSQSADSSLCAVGLWNDNSVMLLNLPDLTEATQVKLGGDTQARSVMLTTLEEKDMLLVGLGDGQLITHELIIKPTPTLGNRKKVSLGTQPIGLSLFRSSDGKRCVFAASDRPTVIYSSSKKVSYANVNFPGEVNHACPFNCELFQDCLSLASETTLTIGTIDDIKKLHVQTWKLGEGPRYIVHNAEARVFGMTVESNETFNAEDEVDQSHTVVFLDDTTFEEIKRFKLEPFEVSLKVCNCALKNEDGDDSDGEDDADIGNYIAVGTAIAHPDEDEASEGRILLFKVTRTENSTTVDLVTEKPTRGGVYSISNLGNKLLAGINSKVSLYKFRNVDGVCELVNECGHHGHILALYTKCKGNLIVVGDLMRSICVLEYNEGALKEVARDYNANWMTDVEIIDDNMYLGSEISSNLFTLKRNSKATADEEKSRLEVFGEFHLGQTVNKFEKGRLGGSGEVGTGKAGKGAEEGLDVLFGTIDGMLGCIHSLNEIDMAFFSSLQSALSKVSTPLGNLRWEDFRSWCSERSERKTTRFIDGDLVESFLDLPKEMQLSVIEEMNTDGGWDLGKEATAKLVEECAASGAGVETDDNKRTLLTMELVMSKIEGMMRRHQ